MLQVNLQLLGGRGAKSTKAAAVPPATKRQSLQTKATIAGVDGKEYRVEYGKNGRLKNKQSVVNYIQARNNIRLENDPNNILNKKRNSLYTTLPRNRSSILRDLKGIGARWEPHLGNSDWIMF